MGLELNPDIFRAIVEDSPNAIYMTDRERRIVFWNTSAERITGYLGQEVIGHLCHDNLLTHCDGNFRALCGAACPLSHTMQDGKPREANIFLRHKQGHRVPVRVRSIPLRDEWGTIIGAAEIFEERHYHPGEGRATASEKEITLDPLTQVADRKSLLSFLEPAVAGFAKSRVPFGMLLVAIDKLEQWRHEYGCQAVNAVLYATAQTLSGGTRPEDLVGRLGEDRFAVLLICPTVETLQACAERLKRLVSLAGVPWWGDRISFTVSMGGTMIRVDDSVDSMLARAEESLDKASVDVDSILVG